MFRRLLDPAPLEGGGTSNPIPVAAPASQAADPTLGYQAALKKHGDDASAFARTTYADNERLRAELAAVNARLPKDGSIVLSGDDASHWTELAKLGKPDVVRASLEAGSAAIVRVSAFERTELMGQAAEPYKFNPKVLEGLARDGLRIEMRDGNIGGKAARVADVITVVKDAKGHDVETKTPLDVYAVANWAEFMPALKAGYKATQPAGSPPSGGGAPRPEIAPPAFRRSLVK